MKYINRTPISNNLSQLSFGTASLYKLHSSRGIQNILSAALDFGINHFDTSPYYGLGLSEIELGKMLKYKNNITIATKIGIFPIKDSHTVPKFFLNKMQRKLFSNSQDYVIDFSTKRADESLNKSLTRLNLDYIDILFLHEPEMPLINLEQMNEWLELQVDKGKILNYGLCGESNNLIPFLESRPNGWNILQTRNSLSGNESKLIAKYTDDIYFTYGYFKDIDHFSDRGIFIKEILSKTQSSIIFSTSKTNHLREIATLIDENI